MVKVTLDLTKNELEMFFTCIESALDSGYLKNEKDKKKASEILIKIQEHLLNSKV